MANSIQADAKLCAPATNSETVIATDAKPAVSRLQAVDSLVKTLVASWHDSPIVQNRHWHRICFDKLIAITPLDEHTDVPIGRATIVQGRDISVSGMSFTHQVLLPFRKIAATFALDNNDYESISIRLTWCRFTSRGLYKSGGKFLRTVNLQIDPDIDWTCLRNDRAT